MAFKLTLYVIEYVWIVPYLLYIDRFDLCLCTDYLGWNYTFPSYYTS